MKLKNSIFLQYNFSCRYQKSIKGTVHRVGTQTLGLDISDSLFAFPRRYCLCRKYWTLYRGTFSDLLKTRIESVVPLSEIFLSKVAFPTCVLLLINLGLEEKKTVVTITNPESVQGFTS